MQNPGKDLRYRLVTVFTVTDHELRLRSARPAFQPMLASETGVGPEEFWNCRAANNRSKNRMRPGGVAQDSVVVPLLEQASELSAGGHERERIARSHLGQFMDRLPGGCEFLAEFASKAQGKFKPDRWRQVEVLNAGQNRTLDSAEQVATMDVENGDRTGRCRLAVGQGRQAF